ncbi:hypothetical protein KY499_13990 [Arthrobacter sp. PAMC25284]|uniref:Uncharacterized protein n=1 Tax=Arthrobacter oryzae TaxID=409290 RepID=A0A3N0BYM7_9MICC|nr:hypothetical protein KY499_13990 [Arthrobacter sp. PAMC25284]RNL54690.1 hypothetical protein D7003_10935 [Arthrobacter oryzae]
MIPISPHRHERREERPDLPSSHVSEAVAMSGRCGNIHLPSGRTCTLTERHDGSCEFVDPHDAEDASR